MLLQKGEVLADIPFGQLLTPNTIPEEFKKMHNKAISMNGLIASFLCNGTVEQYSYWKSTWPSPDDLAETLPIMMPQSLRDEQHASMNGVNRSFRLLPPGIYRPMLDENRRDVDSKDSLSLLSKQEAKLQRDWRMVVKAFSDAIFKQYRYYWLLVNTRCFYCDLPALSEVQNREDKMVLCPFLDFFNHADQGVGVLRSSRSHC